MTGDSIKFTTTKPSTFTILFHICFFLSVVVVACVGHFLAVPKAYTSGLRMARGFATFFTIFSEGAGEVI